MDAGPTIDVHQIIYALERQVSRLEHEADMLLQQLDYRAEFPAADAERLSEAIDILRRQIVTP